MTGASGDARDADLLARPGDRRTKDSGPAPERPRLQPAGPAVARRSARHAEARERQFQGRAERQRQSHLQQRLPARRRRQHLVLELVPRRKRAARPAVDRSASGVQDSDQRLLGRVRPQLRRGRQCHDQVRHQPAARQRLRVPQGRCARRQQLFFEAAGSAQAEAQAQPVRRRDRRTDRAQPDVLVRRLRRAARSGRHSAHAAGADRGGEGRAVHARPSTIRLRRAARNSAGTRQDNG